MKFQTVKIVLCMMLFFFGCQMFGKKKAIIYLDMSKQHDQGLFKPESGDQMLIAGNFNNWDTNIAYMRDEDNDWIYSIDLFSIAGKKLSPADTIEFNFYKRIKLETEEAHDYSIKEKISIRKIVLANLMENKPTFIFNQETDQPTIAKIIFTVGTANQQVLGFFNPQKGDEVVVSGDFCNWNSDGITMLDTDNDSIYKITIPIKYSSGRSILYKYRLKSQNTVIPNNGWESVNNRMLLIQGDSAATPFIEFNNMHRVLRFIINTASWGKKQKFQPRKNDILQIKLITDEKMTLSNPLMKVNRFTYETAIVVPANIKKVEWQLILNKNQSLTALKEVQVGFNGKIIKL
jgi:hypothetical protein